MEHQIFIREAVTESEIARFSGNCTPITGAISSPRQSRPRTSPIFSAMSTSRSSRHCTGGRKTACTFSFSSAAGRISVLRCRSSMVQRTASASSWSSASTRNFAETVQVTPAVRRCSLGRTNAGQATLSSTATLRRASASGADLAFCRTAATSGAKS